MNEQAEIADREPKWKIDIPLFEPEIRAFEEHDKTAAPMTSGAIFTGSSSIRIWPDIEKIFAPHNVLNRGFGGSSVIHNVHFATRVFGPHTPDAIVFYAGENDLESDLAPPDVARQFEKYTDFAWRRRSDTKIAFISAKPSPFRMRIVEKIRETNRLIYRQIDCDARLFYLDVFSEMLDENGDPREELYCPDTVHMSAQGYELWTPHVRAFLENEVPTQPSKS